MRVYAFVGPSGTGKSYRAQMVAGENNISYIIDDGLLVNENVTKFYNNKYAGGSDTGITGDTAADVINNTLKGLDGSTAYDGVEIKYTEAVAANPSASPAVEAQDATITISAKADSSKKTTGKINATTGAITWTDAYND